MNVSHSRSLTFPVIAETHSEDGSPIKKLELPSKVVNSPHHSAFGASSSLLPMLKSKSFTNVGIAKTDLNQNDNNAKINRLAHLD